jgi:hypothetical protein
MLTSDHCRVRLRRIIGLLILICVVADFFPRHGAPDFRYTGSDPTHQVWNLGWPIALTICDSASGIHLGPFLYVVVPFQVVLVSLVALVLFFRQRHNEQGIASDGAERSSDAMRG